ncbi:hypothetical protein AJ79_00098 [Helicocarpus griseus UAMH5409]|uniref:Rhodopsin domain-containing protein n=1 Tax=Helicocarpus griseus UAMH5409 TaxID=1447875 RepID=A0A2B7Y4K2_9EURO|nr:hypothetical protein AJ79_00098 [Helicocarpus griseus UAMH5409]
MAGRDYVNLFSLRATIYSLLAITTVIIAVRLYGPLARPRTFQWDDGWMVSAYIWFLTLSILYLVLAQPMLRVQDARSGKAPLYATMADDGALVKRTLFFASPFFWFCLWSVKFSLLSLYKRFTKGLKVYTRIWFGVTIFCALALVGACITSLVACQPVSGWFKADGCRSQRDAWASNVSVWYAFAADVATDLAVMVLPVGLIWGLRMPLAQKMSIGALFCLGLVVIAVSVIRVTELKSNVGLYDIVNPVWLAFWAELEAAIAVIIGCCPGLYRIFKTRSLKKKSTYNSRSYGYGKSGSRGPLGSRATANDIALQPRLHSAIKITKTTEFNVSTRVYGDDASSQEELTGDQMYVYPGR